MSVYEQCTLRMATVKYVTQDVHIRCRYARHILEVLYSNAVNTVLYDTSSWQRMSTVLDL